MCIILASRREELHLYSLQVIKDLAVSTPHPWLRGHFEGTDRSDSLNVGFMEESQAERGIARLGLGLDRQRKRG